MYTVSVFKILFAELFHYVLFCLHSHVSLPINRRTFTAAAKAPVKLQGAELTTALATVPHWRKIEGKDAITREFAFSNFVQAFGFMTQCALHAEKMDHHPEWFNVYNRIEVTLNTHDVQGLSEKDFILAGHMDDAAEHITLK
jgi:4a-hydroxytetrahydrobiopterin dehydratase